MASYQLTIQFDRQGLIDLHASGLGVGLIQGTADDIGYVVAGVIFAPSESNYLTWDDALLVYAAGITALSPLDVLRPNAWTPATIGDAYTFEDGLIQTDGAGKPSVITLLNNDSQTAIAGGLSRVIQVNGTTPPTNPPPPMTVDGISYNSTGFFTDFYVLTLLTITSTTRPGTIFPASWLTTSNAPGMDITLGKGLQLDFSKSRQYQVKYDDTTGTFSIKP